MEPLVSIGLCARNGAEYLRGALDSLLAQTYKNFEVIISNNASTDGTREICEEYAKRDRRIRYIRQKENIGSFGNYDFVRKEGRGDYFMWAACDDFWHPLFLEKCIKRFGEAPDTIMVFPNFCAFDDASRVMKLNPEKYFPFSQDIYKRIKTYILHRSQNGKITMIYGLWKKNIPADLISLSDCHGDTIFMLRTLLSGCFANVPEVLFYKRGLLQFPIDLKKEKPSLHFLTTLPEEKYETLEYWHSIRKRLEKERSAKDKLKYFLANRLQATKYFYKISKYTFLSPNLTLMEKIKLLFWAFYAYLKSFWHGYM